MKRFLQQLIKGALAELVADLKKEYLEEVVYDFYFVKYTIGNKKGDVMVRVESKGNFRYELDKNVRIKHKKSPEDDLSFKVDYIFKL